MAKQWDGGWTTLIVRRATVSDLGQLCELNKKLLAYDSALDISINECWDNSEYLAKLFDNPAHNFIFVLEKQGKLFGYIIGELELIEGYRNGYYVMDLAEVYIEDEYRSKGFGKMLFQALISHTKQLQKELYHSLDRFSVRVSAQNSSAIQFYKKIGFVEYDLILEMKL